MSYIFLHHRSLIKISAAPPPSTSYKSGPQHSGTPPSITTTTMDGDTLHHRSPRHTTTINLKNNTNETNVTLWLRQTGGGGSRWRVGEVAFMKWTAGDVAAALKCHPIPCLLVVSLLFFMGVEYTLLMVPPSSPPFDIGFVTTVHLHRVLAASPALNTVLAGLNTVFVLMQTVYIIGTFVVEGRPRATVATLLMFTFRGILGYSTQLPLPKEFLGSGVDFPVGNVSFFLFYSGHVAGSVIASLDMRRMQRIELAFLFDLLNILQVLRLLSTRGHYTIDLIVGVGAAILFDSLAEMYINRTTKMAPPTNGLELKSNGHPKGFLKVGNGHNESLVQ